MSMKFDNDNNVIFTFNYLDMLDSLSDEQSIELAESLSCQDAVIKNVVDQIMHGCTENGYHGTISSSDLPSTELEKSQERIRKMGNRLLIKEIERLRRKIADKNSHYESGWNEYHKLMKSLRGQ